MLHCPAKLCPQAAALPSFREKHCVIPSCRNLGVGHSLIQRWNVALSGNILSASDCAAIISGEALCDTILQKPGCRTFPHPNEECCIVQQKCVRKPQRCHHFGRSTVSCRLQKPGCRTFPHPKVECCIVRQNCVRKPQRCHHFGRSTV